jgi:hypothetical protein
MRLLKLLIPFTVELVFCYDLQLDGIILPIKSVCSAAAAVCVGPAGTSCYNRDAGERCCSSGGKFKNSGIVFLLTVFQVIMARAIPVALASARDTVVDK